MIPAFWLLAIARTLDVLAHVEIVVITITEEDQ